MVITNLYKCPAGGSHRFVYTGVVYQFVPNNGFFGEKEVRPKKYFDHYYCQKCMEEMIYQMVIDICDDKSSPALHNARPIPEGA